MKKKTPFLWFPAAILLGALAFSCVSAAQVPDPAVQAPDTAVQIPEPAVQEGGLSSNTLKLVQNAVFEVVLEKPASDPITYEKELDWERVPYAIRTDKYLSIGTAFAISETELATAFHVINLGFKSMAYPRYYVRDSEGKVYEVDKVTGGSNERDFLIFTVKGRTFSDFFKFDRDYKIGDPVYSIGNALGEGIVVRNGLVLGTVPEEESGRWNLLKSSADGNPGNSGGPLVRPNGNVVALVTGLRDNILYSTPADVILDHPRGSLAYRIRPGYSHLILANNGKRIFETSVPLPEQYLAAREKIIADYRTDYEAAMTNLFSEAPEYLTGPNNRYLLNSSLSSVFPELDFVDKNDDNWKLSSLERKSYNLADDGRLWHSSVSGFSFYKINKPKTVPLETINTDPRYIMDMILANIRMERTLWGNDKYRILSFGDPSGTGEYRDSLGRKWLTAHWVIGFDDEVLIMFILPLPNGPALITTMQDSSQRDVYEWDIRKTSDHTHVIYSADLKGWNDFLALKEYVPEFLRDFKYDWQEADKEIFFESGGIALRADSNVFDWADSSELFLAPSWYKSGDKITFGIRKFIINRDVRGKEYTVLYKNIKPDERLGANAAENWNDLLDEKFPFDGKPAVSVKDNTGSVGIILKPDRVDDNVRYSLYLSMENPQDEENLSRRFNFLKEGIQVAE
jgi:hypothetical protein